MAMVKITPVMEGSRISGSSPNDVRDMRLSTHKAVPSTSFAYSYPGWNDDKAEMVDKSSMDRRQEMHEGSCKHPQMLALKKKRWTYPNHDRDRDKAVSYFRNGKDNLLDNVLKHGDVKQKSWKLLKSGDRSNEVFVALDASKFTYQGWETDHRLVEKICCDTESAMFRFDLMERRQRVHDDDCSHPLFLELKSKLWSYRGHEREIESATKYFLRGRDAFVERVLKDGDRKEKEHLKRQKLKEPPSDNEHPTPKKTRSKRMQEDKDDGRLRNDHNLESKYSGDTDQKKIQKKKSERKEKKLDIKDKHNSQNSDTTSTKKNRRSGPSHRKNGSSRKIDVDKSTHIISSIRQKDTEISRRKQQIEEGICDHPLYLRIQDQNWSYPNNARDKRSAIRHFKYGKDSVVTDIITKGNVQEKEWQLSDNLKSVASRKIASQSKLQSKRPKEKVASDKDDMKSVSSRKTTSSMKRPSKRPKEKMTSDEGDMRSVSSKKTASQRKIQSNRSKEKMTSDEVDMKSVSSKKTTSSMKRPSKRPKEKMTSDEGDMRSVSSKKATSSRKDISKRSKEKMTSDEDDMRSVSSRKTASSRKDISKPKKENMTSDEDDMKSVSSKKTASSRKDISKRSKEKMTSDKDDMKSVSSKKTTSSRKSPLKRKMMTSEKGESRKEIMYENVVEGSDKEQIQDRLTSVGNHKNFGEQEEGNIPLEQEGISDEIFKVSKPQSKRPGTAGKRRLQRETIELQTRELSTPAFSISNKGAIYNVTNDRRKESTRRKKQLVEGDYSHPILQKMEKRDWKYPGNEADMDAILHYFNEGHDVLIESTMKIGDIKEKSYIYLQSGRRKKAVLVALDSEPFDYPGFSLDKAKVEELCYDADSSFRELEGMRRRQGLYDGSCEDEKYTMIRNKKWSYPGNELDLEAALRYHKRGKDMLVTSVLQKGDKLQKKFLRGKE